KVPAMDTPGRRLPGDASRKPRLRRGVEVPDRRARAVEARSIRPANSSTRSGNLENRARERNAPAHHDQGPAEQNRGLADADGGSGLGKSFRPNGDLGDVRHEPSYPALRRSAQGSHRDGHTRSRYEDHHRRHLRFRHADLSPPELPRITPPTPPRPTSSIAWIRFSARQRLFFQHRAKL